MADTPPNQNMHIGQLPASVPTVGAFLSGATLAVVEADSMAKDAAVNRIRSLLTPDKNGNLPSVQYGYDFNIPGSLLDDKGGGKDVDFQTRIQVPAVIFEPDRAVGVQSAEIDWNMTIHSTAVDESDIQAQESGSGEGSVGWGPFKATVKISASASESETKKRTTDDTATMSAKVVMAQMPVSEGCAMVNSTTRRWMRLEEGIVDQLVDAKVAVLRQQAGIPLPSNGGSQPSPQPSGGGGGG